MLDADKLIQHGLTKNRMMNDMELPDAAFFYQLILPYCDPEKSGIANDKRKPFYTKVSISYMLYHYDDLLIYFCSTLFFRFKSFLIHMLLTVVLVVHMATTSN